jgi:hypothetical protein
MMPLPRWGMMLFTAASIALYLGLAVCGWGGWSVYYRLTTPGRLRVIDAWPR